LELVLSRFAKSKAWSGTFFQEEFFRNLYLHGVFTEKHIEKSDINGNHYTADAAGLVFAGLFFGCTKLTEGGQIAVGTYSRRNFLDKSITTVLTSKAPSRITGWSSSCFWPGCYRAACVLPYLSFIRIGCPMARFTAAYSRADGTAPLWEMPTTLALYLSGPQKIGDHRYVLGLAGCVFRTRPEKNISVVRGKRSSVDTRSSGIAGHGWSACISIRIYCLSRRRVLRDRNECAPYSSTAGLWAWRAAAGHGHNDLLSFEAVLEACI